MLTLFGAAAVTFMMLMNRYRAYREQPAPRSETPIACSLSAGELAQRNQAGRNLAERAMVGSPVTKANGIQLRFLDTAEDEVRALIEAESKCCPFLDFQLQSGPTLVLDVQGPDEARPLILGLFGLDQVEK